MTITEIAKLVDGEIVGAPADDNYNVRKAFASDLMSDVLTLKDTPILVTGLCNVQTIRTCDMATLDIVVFVRNKKPTPDMVELAEDNDMVLIATSYSMFKTCGLLFDAGIQPLY